MPFGFRCAVIRGPGMATPFALIFIPVAYTLFADSMVLFWNAKPVVSDEKLFE